MELNIYPDYETLSLGVAQEILTEVTNNPTAVLCLAAGDTPRLAYDILVRKASEEKTDFSRCTFIGLDEWVGIPPENEGTCSFFLESRLFRPLNIDAERLHLFNGLSEDLMAECSKANAAIEAAGGIDLMLVGVGMNGHIGFNEPGVSPENYAHLIELADTTQSVGQKYFKTAVAIKQGLTLGLKQVLQSRKLIMMASGEKKATIMQQALEEAVHIDLPAGIVRKHKKGHVMIDKKAAALLDLKALSPEIVLVPGSQNWHIL